MAYAIPNEATHATVVTIRFAEGEPEESVLHFGSFEACDEVARTLPAVVNKGPRIAVSASVSVYPLVPFCAEHGQRCDPHPPSPDKESP